MVLPNEKLVVVFFVLLFTIFAMVFTVTEGTDLIHSLEQRVQSQTNFEDTEIECSFLR